MKALSDLSIRIGESVMWMSLDRMELVEQYIQAEFKMFREEWPGNYELYWELEGESKLAIGVRFNSIQDKHWAEIRWS